VKWPRSLQIIRATRAKPAAAPSKKRRLSYDGKSSCGSLVFLQGGFACVTRFRHPLLCVLPYGPLVVTLNTMLSKESAKNWDGARLTAAAYRRWAVNCASWNIQQLWCAQVVSVCVEQQQTGRGYSGEALPPSRNTRCRRGRKRPP
jgi:hypothetical protein